MPTTNATDGTPLHYRVLGEGSRDVVLVHGWMVSGAVWDAMLEKLDLTGLRLIVPDHRGSGKSGRPASGYTLAQYAKDVMAVADHAGAKRFALVGHSMGGQIAKWVAADAPERITGLVLLNTVPASGLPLPSDAAGLFRTSAGDREKQRTILSLACKELSPESLERLLQDSGEVARDAIEQCFDSWTAGGFADRLSAITAATLVVATDDPFLPPSFLKQSVVALIRGARLAHLPGPGHYPQVERPTETAALVSAFLAGSSAQA
ncbi:MULTISPECIES: alpha/beta fold hydrolase [Corallococcus]|uniref:alpha/beta fold hydrolase n=1 Tax=Corallococcus TaxID=83461 RepID=UPI00117D5030|nr:MULTISPECIES: alpha/beta hydrolase [Corallococcus]NBD09618.1 alpha/beta fold hydrolase [Corallococcus silvisoli]TSC24116.1 alpha/beta hydrolase [Corallococcus sp. Z5C101001]